MNVRFLRPARAELIEAVKYYNGLEGGLGFEFDDEIRLIIEKIKRFPEAWPLVSKGTRRCRAKRFPYGVIYQVKANTLIIIAVVHLRRDPELWMRRIREQRR